MLRLLLLLCPAAAWPDCLEGFSLSGADVEDPLPASSPDVCAEHCMANSKCTAYEWHAASPCSDHGEECALEGGCCMLKHGGDMNPVHGGIKPNNNKCSCSALVRVPTAKLPPKPGRASRNVLYILFDDLRPELPGIYGHNYVHAPNIKRLMDSGTVFRRAYCQIAVCSPSRMSFLTGRRPTITRSMNFMDHVRQADCGINQPDSEPVTSAEVIATLHVDDHTGGTGQCCTSCTEETKCTHWSYQKPKCMLFAGNISGFKPAGGVISGVSGVRSQWTSLPGAFKKSGWLTMGSGKVFHTEEGGIGPPPELNGKGMPPNQDPESWSSGLSMSHVNDVAPMDDASHSCFVSAGSSDCPVDALADGSLKKVKTGTNDGEFEDKIIANDGITKLRLGAHVWNETGRPFFLTIGFRKPHLSFRFPAPFLDLYPDVANVTLAKHQILDRTIPAIAHQDTHHPGQEPWAPMHEDEARRFRLYYAATISWVDSQLGRVLKELQDLGLENDTVIAMHSDHGWSLGEQGEWQKFTNFELGARVPLVIRDPMKPPAVSDAVVELVDVMPTLMDLAGMSSMTPSGDAYELDGTSLRPLLDGRQALGRVGLSLYPRCPNGNQPVANSTRWWKDNSCLFVDRTKYSFMGLSIRTDSWRYTEWRFWNGKTEAPDWDADPVAVELYDHRDDDGTDFDSFENRNLWLEAPKNVLQDLAALTRKKYKLSTEEPSRHQWQGQPYGGQHPTQPQQPVYVV